MDKTFLEESPEVAPILVQLHDRHKLYSLARDKDETARAELTDIMVDLLNIDLSEREQELLADVVISLIRQAERDLKVALSERLASMKNVPLRMVLHLANDEIDIAEAVLRESTVLQDMDLVYIIKSKGKAHWQNIARRTNLGPAVINALAETHDEDTAINLAANDSVILTDQAISVFVEMSKASDALAKPLLHRDELPGIIGQVLYEFVGEEIKAIIRERFPIHIDMVESVARQVDDLVLEFTETQKRDEIPEPSSIAIEAAQTLATNDEIRIDTLVGALKRGQMQSFIAMFAEFSRLSINTVKELLRQDTGQGLAVACKALDIPKGDFVSMYLLTKKIRHGQGKVVDNKELARASAYYDKMSREVAKSILNSSRH